MPSAFFSIFCPRVCCKKAKVSRATILVELALKIAIRNKLCAPFYPTKWFPSYSHENAKRSSMLNACFGLHSFFQLSQAFHNIALSWKPLRIIGHCRILVTSAVSARRLYGDYVFFSPPRGRGKNALVSRSYGRPARTCLSHSCIRSHSRQIKAVWPVCSG